MIVAVFIAFCVWQFYRLVIRRACAEFAMYDMDFGEVAVIVGRFSVFVEDGSRSVEYCCYLRNHETLAEANGCWRQWKHYTNLSPVLCKKCGSNIDVTPDMPCLQCAVNERK
jgi:hypothetical protein